MAWLLICRTYAVNSRNTNIDIIPVFQSDVPSRVAYTYRVDLGNIPEGDVHVEQCQEREHGRGDCQLDVRRRATLHGAHRLLKYDLECPAANRTGAVLFVGDIGAVRAGRLGRNDHPNSHQRLHCEQSEDTADTANEEQGRARETDERGAERNQSVEVVRVGAQLRAANIEDQEQGD